ncbi:PREDICTED: endochitinase At2g43580-like [Camelina sativa]|uniref:Endochitinase At2g43580-like n=1 Tax=Camelina sativa TaxID=90675 RepID=A0ABM0ZMR0_CAMSA|nr:PREDICTED: endochitinase At2g43580-like [Camelina sativa]
MALTKINLILLISLLAFYSETVKSQNCNCAPNLCCSQFGYCGTTADHCGPTCRSGPCRGGGSPTSADLIGSIATQSFFNNIINQAGNNCAGKIFYTHDSFINATNTFPNFANTVTRREIATMFAHFTYETGHFCYIEEIGGASRTMCDQSNRQYPCVPGKSYHGRGPFLLSWNFNYGPCGQFLGLDLLRQPELVSSNPIVAFRAALWFWMKSVRPVLNQGFGATVRAVSGLECDGRNVRGVNARVGYYRDYCGQLGVDPGSNITC